MKHLSSIACLVSLLSTFVLSQHPVVGVTVKTSSGAVTGHAARNRTEVSEYLGIPYAQPPIGVLRFAAPQTYHSTRAFSASTYVRRAYPLLRNKRNLC